MFNSKFNFRTTAGWVTDDAVRDLLKKGAVQVEVKRGTGPASCGGSLKIIALTEEKCLELTNFIKHNRLYKLHFTEG